MKQGISAFRILSITLSFLGFIAAQTTALTPAPLDPCTMITKADIEKVTGQNVSDGKLTGSGNAAAGAPCQYMVGMGGVFSLVTKAAASGETAANVMGELTKRKIPVAKVSGLGDSSFYSSPGYGMVQLNTFKGPYYLIVTILIPGVPEATLKTKAADLMKIALGKI